MSDQEKHTPPERRYPPFYEKAVPIILAIIGLFVLVLFVVIVAVALGKFPALP